MNAAPRTSASAALAHAKALAEAGQADAALAAARALVAEGEALEPGERAEAMLCIAVIELRSTTFHLLWLRASMSRYSALMGVVSRRSSRHSHGSVTRRRRKTPGFG